MIRVLPASPDPLQEAPLKVLPVSRTGLSPRGQALDQALEGRLSRALEGARFKGREGETLFLPLPEGAFLLYGTEEGEARTLGGKLAQTLRKLDFPEALVEPTEPPRAFLEGLFLGSYRFEKYRSEKGGQTLTVRLLGGQEKDLREVETVAQGVAWARDLVNEPPNRMTPEALAEAALTLRDLGVEVEILDEKAIAELGMGAFLAVAQGSENPPRFIKLRYEGGGSRLDLVGKGLTFDSGGYSLKPTEGMATMKGDMAGAAAVLGAFKAIAELGLSLELRGYIAACENLVSGRAYKLGDVLKTLSGKTVEVMNTDAEGRLTLADALAYAEREGAERILELSTLTGAATVALGEEIAALFATEEAFGQLVKEAAEEAGEKVWPMPMDRAYREKLKSPVADLKNVGDRYGGAITAALFLAEFVKVPLVHLDIAGPAFARKAHPLGPEGGTGFGVRTIVALARRLAQG